MSTTTPRTRRHELHPRAATYLSWLLIAASVPFFSYLPLWVGCAFAGVVAWRFWSDRRGVRTPARWLRYSALISVSGYLIWDMSARNFSSLETFVAWFVVLGSFKLLETVKTRDVRMLVLMTWMTAACLQLFDQTSAHLLFGVMIALFGAVVLRALYDPEDLSTGLFRATGGVVKLFIMGLPIGLLVFFVFPRFSVRTLGLGLDQQLKAQSGFSDDVDPGSVTQLAQSDEIVMRVTFPGEQVLRVSNLYWRGAVLNRSEGLRWTRTLTPAQWSPDRERPGIEQIITLEPQRGRWLFALDRPHTATWVTEVLHANLLIDPLAVLTPAHEITNRVVYRAVSDYSPQIATEDGNDWLTVKNSERWPKTVAFAQELKKNHRDPDSLAHALMQYLQKENFVYTLAPGAIPGDSLDYFMFNSKKGFCEHFAAAAATILRLSGVPARVVVGFQGGTFNDIGGFVQIKNKDAHAWLEYLSPTKGWHRLDPVNFVAPERISLGADQYFNSRDALLGDFQLLSGWIGRSSWVNRKWQVARQAMEAIDYSISQFLLDFDFSTQAKWFRLNENYWPVLLAITIAIILLGALFLRVLSNNRGRGRDHMLDLLREAKLRLEAAGIPTEEWQAPRALTELIDKSGHERANLWRLWLSDWESFRYRPGPRIDWLSFRELRGRLKSL